MKKIKQPYTLELTEDLFCRTKRIEQNAVSHKFYVKTRDGFYNLVYRDGAFLGMPQFFGGKIYPFAKDMTKQGSWLYKRQFSEVDIICFSNDFKVKVNWGTTNPFLMVDTATKQPYTVGATGVFYISIDESDAARNANLFYQKLVKQYSRFNDVGLLDYPKETLRNYLKEAFANRIGAKIQEFLEMKNLSLSNLVGLQPGEFVQISEELFPLMEDMFADNGLRMDKKLSSSSMLTSLTVRPKEDF